MAKKTSIMAIVDTCGRPTKYKPEYCEALIEHMSQGLSFEAFSAVIDVNQDTLHEWAKVHSRFSEAKKQAFSKCRLFWEKIGIEGIWNVEGKTLNTGNYCFQMKNRFKWTDRVEVEAGEKMRPIVLAYDPTNLGEE